MRVFVCEFVTGGGFCNMELSVGLCREGDMMLQALVKDFSDLPQLTVAAARDRRRPELDLPVEHRWIEPGDDPWAAWGRHAADADAVLPIAPETDGLLARLSALFIDGNRKLLSSRPAAVRIAASKIGTAAHLAQMGLPVAPTIPLDSALSNGLPRNEAGWVVKPDDGAGCEDTFLLRSEGALRRWAADHQDDAQDIGRLAVQPYLPGAATSLSLLCADGRTMVLSCNDQDVRLDGDRFRFHGGTVAGREQRRPLYEPIAAQIAGALPELWGFVGVDLVETESGPVILEVNPRVTTSYFGLRRATGFNPAELLMLLATEGWAAVAPLPKFYREAVSFDVSRA